MAEVSFLGMVAFFILRAARRIQQPFAFLFWHLVNAPLLFSAKFTNDIDAEKKKDFPELVVIDTLKFGKSALLKAIRISSRIQTAIHGVQNKQIFRKRLFRWNSKIPLIGFVEDTGQRIETLFSHHQNGGRWASDFSITHNKVFGNFLIVEKAVVGTGIDVTCVWISGPEEGKVFKVIQSSPKSFEELRNLSNSEVTTPSSIYLPPRPMLFLCEVLFSIGAIFVLFKIAHEGYQLVHPTVDAIWMWLETIVTNLWK